MIEKTETELRKWAMVKTLRSLIQLKHSLLSFEELNTVLPRAEKEFDKALHKGVLPESIDIEAIARKAVGE